MRLDQNQVNALGQRTQAATRCDTTRSNTSKNKQVFFLRAIYSDGCGAVNYGTVITREIKNVSIKVILLVQICLLL